MPIIFFLKAECFLCEYLAVTRSRGAKALSAKIWGISLAPRFKSHLHLQVCNTVLVLHSSDNPYTLALLLSGFSMEKTVSINIFGSF